MSILFIVFLFFISIYAMFYIFYSIFILRNLRRSFRLKRNASYFPSVSVIICAYNEEKTIARKIENTLNIEYPHDKMEIIVFDNGSEDTTFEVAKKFVERRIKLYKLNGKNEGKSAGLNVAFKHAKNDIVVISDVDCLLEKDILIKSMPYFADTQIGAVTGSQTLLNPSHSSSTRMEDVLQSYYKAMHKAESIADSTIVYKGEFTAFRRNLIKKLDEDVGSDDIQIAIKVREAGYRAIFVEEATFYVYAPSNFRIRWKQKARRSAQTFQALIRYRNIIFDRDYGIYGMVIYPWNFFMHVISPYLFAFLSVFSSLLLIFDFWNMIKAFAIIMPAIVVIVAIIHIRLYQNFSISGIFNTLITFIHAQLALLVGSLGLIWKKPFRWEPLHDTRRF